MDEWSAWEVFFTTGYVNDYLNFQNARERQNTLNNLSDQKNGEKSDEILDGRSNNQRTEYR